MDRITITCGGELNDFLGPERRHRTIEMPWPGRASIKDTLESIGVPHPEVALLLVNQAPVPWAYLMQPGDAVEAFPHVETRTMPFPPLLPPPQPHFVLDVHLGRLAEQLRLLGFDTLYRNDYDDPELAEIGGNELRILLTRDLGLLKRSSVVYGSYVRATDPAQQVIEVMRRFDLFDAIRPFTRCSRCNGVLEPVDKAAILDRIQPQTRQEHDQFQRCTGCGNIYWQGSHYARLQAFVESILQHRP